MRYIKIPKRVFAMLFGLYFVFSLISCSSDVPVKKDAVLEHLRSKIYETSPIPDEAVFWLKGGSVYHLYRDCSFLEKADDVRQGAASESGRNKVCEVCEKRRFDETVQAQSESPEEEALSGTQDDLPSGLIQLDGAETADDIQNRSLIQEESEGTDPAANGQVETVYWTPSGSVWHSDPNCTSLSRSKDVRSGTVAQSGKERGCKICSPSD